jgi:hypothetical protein
MAMACVRRRARCLLLSCSSDAACLNRAYIRGGRISWGVRLDKRASRGLVAEKIPVFHPSPERAEQLEEEVLLRLSGSDLASVTCLDVCCCSALFGIDLDRG